jgi:hypothetical protein
VQGLVLEFERWVAGTDENDDEWWKDRHEWVIASRLVEHAGAAVQPPADTEAARQLAGTAFDQVQGAARAQEALRRDEIAALMGGTDLAGASSALRRP